MRAISNKDPVMDRFAYLKQYSITVSTTPASMPDIMQIFALQVGSSITIAKAVLVLVD